MTTMIVPLKLKDGVTGEAYEKWATERDIPAATSLPAVDSFHLYKVNSTLDGSDSPFDYVEVITINDLEKFPSDVAASAEMAEITSELAGYIGSSHFLLTEQIA